MNQFKFLTLILFLVPITTYSQNNLIQLSQDSTTNLSFSQFNKYSKVINQDDFELGYFVNLAEVSQLQENGIIEFEIPGVECLIKAQTTRVSYFDSDNYYWSARLITGYQEGNNCIDGDISILKKEGEFIGNFNIENNIFLLEDLGDNLQYLAKFDTNNFEICANSNSNQSQDLDSPLGSEGRESNSSCPVTILVLYTDNAENSVPNIDLTIDMAVEQTNNAFQNSNVEFQIELVHKEKINFNETSGIEHDVWELEDDPNIISIREQHFADIVVILTGSNYDGYNGVASTFGPNGPRAYAIVEAPAARSGKTFPHEIGHLFGCRHQISNDDNGPFEHAYRFNISIFQQRRTLMWNTSKRARILHYSNPTVHYNGVLTGVHSSKDNARKLEATNCEVSGFLIPLEDHTELSGYIEAPVSVCLEADVPVHAQLSGDPTNTYTYDWSYSYDGFNYISFGLNNSGVVIPGMPPPILTDNYYIFIRLDASSQIGNTITLFTSVEATNESSQEGDPPCALFSPESPQNYFQSVKDYSLIIPNPTKNYINILFQNYKNEIKSFSIYDMNGGVLKTVSSEFYRKVDVSSFPPGIYYIEIKYASENEILKFIKS